MKNRIIYIQLNDDWEGIYVNGKLYDEGHELGKKGNRFFYLLELSEKLKLKNADILILYAPDDLCQQVKYEGCLPTEFHEIGHFFDWETIEPLKCTCDKKLEKCCDSIPDCPLL